MRTDLAYAQSLDVADPLAHFRGHFAHSDESLVYVDGNSLGRMPNASLALANDLVSRQWGERLIRSVANLTRQDGVEFLQLAPQVPIKTEINLFPLRQANEALEALRNGKFQGAAVLVPE